MIKSALAPKWLPRPHREICKEGVLLRTCRVGLLASVALGPLGYHEAMGSLQGAWKLSWNLTSGPQQRAEMKLGYLRVCSRASDNPSFICIGVLCSVSHPLPWLLCWLLAWLLA